MEDRKQIKKWLEEEMANITYGIGEPIDVYELCEKMVKRINDMPSEQVSDDYVKAIFSWEDSHEEWDRLVIRQTAKHFADWQKQQMEKNAINATLHPDDCEIWVNEGDLREYDDFEKVKVIILKNEL